MSEPSYEELKAQLERIWEQSAAQKSPVIPNRDDPKPEPSALDASPYRECIESLREYVWNLPHSILCPVCGNETIERKKSALELWEEFLSAPVGEEKDWWRRTQGRLLKLANYVLILVAVAAMIEGGLYLLYFGGWLMIRAIGSLLSSFFG